MEDGKTRFAGFAGPFNFLSFEIMGSEPKEATPE